jgi:hypothetical protein
MDHGEQARKEAHQPRGAAPGLQLHAVQAPGSRPRGKQEGGRSRRVPQHRNVIR